MHTLSPRDNKKKPQNRTPFTNAQCWQTIAPGRRRPTPKTASRCGTTRTRASPIRGRCSMWCSWPPRCTWWWRWPTGTSKYFSNVLYVLQDVSIKRFWNTQTELFAGDAERQRRLHVGEDHLQLAVFGAVHVESGGADRHARPRVRLLD